MTRGSFTNYVLFPTKFSFPMMVRILSICLKFVRAFCQKWGKKKLNPAECRVSLSSPSRSPPPDLPPPTGSPSPCSSQPTSPSSYSSDHKEHKSNFSSLRPNVKIRIDNTEIQLSLHYLYKSATSEAKKFVKSEKIARTMVEKGGIL